MIVYLDKEFKCHTAQTEGVIAVDTPFFNSKCAEFIEGYRFIPYGESWTREDGKVFAGEMAFPWKPYAVLDAAQREYERERVNGEVV